MQAGTSLQRLLLFARPTQVRCRFLHSNLLRRLPAWSRPMSVLWMPRAAPTASGKRADSAIVMGSEVVARDTSVPADTAKVAGVVDVVADAVADAALAAVVAREEVEGEVATAVNANK